MKKSKLLLTAIVSTGTLVSLPYNANAEDVNFNSCNEAWEAGYGDINYGEPGYSTKLNRDRDGKACELKNANGKYKSRTQDGTPLNKISDNNNSNNDIVNRETDYVVKQGDVIGITLNKYGQDLKFTISDENIAKINKVTDNHFLFLGYRDNSYKINVKGLHNGIVTLNILDDKGDKIAEKTIKVVSNIERPSSNVDYTIRVGEELAVANHKIRETINVYSENTNIADTYTFSFLRNSNEGTTMGFETKLIGKKEGIVYVYISDRFYKVEVLPANNNNNGNNNNDNNTHYPPTSPDSITPDNPNSIAPEKENTYDPTTKEEIVHVDDTGKIHVVKQNGDILTIDNSSKKSTGKALPKTSAVK